MIESRGQYGPHCDLDVACKFHVEQTFVPDTVLEAGGGTGETFS